LYPDIPNSFNYNRKIDHRSDILLVSYNVLRQLFIDLLYQTYKAVFSFRNIAVQKSHTQSTEERKKLMYNLGPIFNYLNNNGQLKQSIKTNYMVNIRKWTLVRME